MRKRMKNMNLRKALVTFVSLLILVSNVVGQPAFVLHDGTPVRLRLSRNLSSADATLGETVDFEVLDDVKVNEVVVISRGAVALGTVTEAQSKRRMGRAGKLNVNIDHVRLVSDERVALRAVKETKGGSNTGKMTGAIVATSIVFFPAAPLFLLVHGKDITIPKGTEITSYVNGEVSLSATKFGAKASIARKESATAQSNPSKSNHDEKEGDGSPTAARVAKVTITSEIAGAEIELDGQFVGSTPTTLDIVEGVHRITVRNGGKVWERSIRLSVGGSVAVNASFDQTSAPSTSQPPLTVASPSNQSRDTSNGGEPPASESVQPESNNDGATSSETGYANCGESLREVPVSSSKTGLKSLRCGEKVTILGRLGNWVRIRTADNVEGNVSSRFISQHQP
jgi:hypothetical protein